MIPCNHTDEQQFFLLSRSVNEKHQDVSSSVARNIQTNKNLTTKVRKRWFEVFIRRSKNTSKDPTSKKPSQSSVMSANRDQLIKGLAAKTVPHANEGREEKTRGQNGRVRDHRLWSRVDFWQLERGMCQAGSTETTAPLLFFLCEKSIPAKNVRPV